MTEPLEIRRKRLLFRSWRRGMRETDLMLGPFAARHLAELTPPELDRFEALLAVADDQLYDWLSGRAVPPPEHQAFVARILDSRRPTPSA